MDLHAEDSRTKQQVIEQSTRFKAMQKHMDYLVSLKEKSADSGETKVTSVERLQQKISLFEDQE